jgi:hypothetical protein
MLAIAIQIPEARNAKKPAGVNVNTPITTPAQPSHFAGPPWRRTDIPAPNSKVTRIVVPAGLRVGLRHDEALVRVRDIP